MSGMQMTLTIVTSIALSSIAVHLLMSIEIDHFLKMYKEEQRAFLREFYYITLEHAKQNNKGE